MNSSSLCEAMSVLSLSEDSSLPSEEHAVTTLLQDKEQSQRSCNSTLKHQTAMSTSVETQPTALSSRGEVTSTSLLKPHGPTLTTIVPEIRPHIYECLFHTTAKHLLRRRIGIEDDEVITKLAHTFDCSVLLTCRKLYDEALPVFYASQTFHYSLTTGGLSSTFVLSPDDFVFVFVPIRQGAMPPFSDNLHLMVHLSMDLEMIHPELADHVLSKQIRVFSQQCPRLRTLTIHLIGEGVTQDFPADSATGSVLCQLRPRLNRLSILVLATPWKDFLRTLRLSIAGGEEWPSRCWSRQPHIGLNAGSLQWPRLTLPEVIRIHVAGAGSPTRLFLFPDEGDRIYEWTYCRKGFSDGALADSPPLGS